MLRDILKKFRLNVLQQHENGKTPAVEDVDQIIYQATQEIGDALPTVDEMGKVIHEGYTNPASTANRVARRVQELIKEKWEIKEKIKDSRYE